MRKQVPIYIQSFNQILSDRPNSYQADTSNTKKRIPFTIIRTRSSIVSLPTRPNLVSG